MDEKFGIEELSTLSQLSKRQIRYLIQAKILQPPAKEGKFRIFGENHLEALRKIKDLRNKGIKSNVKIKEKLKSQIREESGHYELIPGLHIFISSDLETRKPDLIKNIRLVLNLAGLLDED